MIITQCCSKKLRKTIMCVVCRLYIFFNKTILWDRCWLSHTSDRLCHCVTDCYYKVKLNKLLFTFDPGAIQVVVFPTTFAGTLKVSLSELHTLITHS